MGVQTSSPIFFDIRPACQQYCSYFSMRTTSKFIQPRIAGIMMSAIIIYTLNFKSPTKQNDKLVVSTLAKICDVKDIDLLRKSNFKAKSKMVFLFSIQPNWFGETRRNLISKAVTLIGQGLLKGGEPLNASICSL